MAKKKYKVTSKLWLYPSETAAWHFLSVPKDVAKEIEAVYVLRKRGFGSLRVRVQIGKTVWDTSIFPSKQDKTYLLPVKALVRKAESLMANDRVTFEFSIM